ncbi:protein FAM107B-like [Calonectris borealis]|uniref:protein FAM107B-like n=1 Tax=Calonectris borealis TaxID=1323832 RepID=UPI003F4B42B0
MGLSQSKRGDDKAPRSGAVPEGDGSDVLSPDTATDGHGGLIQPRKVPNPMRESRSYRELHRELLFSHSRGILPRHRAELPRVLESRRLRQLREELRGPPSDLEQQLRKRHQRLEEWEVAAGPDPDPRPEFLLVRDSLRKMKLVEPGAWQPPCPVGKEVRDAVFEQISDQQPNRRAR